MISVGNLNIIRKRKLQIWSFSFLGLFTVLSIPSCSEVKNNEYPQLRYEIHGEAQGTTYNIVYFTDQSVIQKIQVDSILDEIDLAVSIWVPNSVISDVNNADVRKFTIAPPSNTYFQDNFLLSKEVYENTNGAFNPTIGALANAWGFGFKNRENMDSILVDSLLQTVGFSAKALRMTVSDSGLTLWKEKPNTNLDYNGIAQGYSVDVLADYFRNKGVNHFMIEVGGELIANGRKSDGSFWIIGIDKPVDKNRERVLAASLKLDNMSVATSGNYRKFYEKDGVRYAHTLDPKTGFPVQHSLLSATVIMPNCALADAYATAFMVMGIEASKNLIKSNPQWGIEAYFIYYDSESQYQTFMTPGIQEFVVEL